MSKPTDPIDLDLAHMARLLHDAEQRGDIEIVLGCRVRIDRLLDRRLDTRR